MCVYVYARACKVTNWEKEQLRRAVLSRVIAWQWCIVRDVRSVLSSYIIVTNIYSRNMFTVRWTLTKQSQTSDRPVCARAAKKKRLYWEISSVCCFVVSGDKRRNRPAMYSDGHEVDGSWVLHVYVTDLQVERTLRVKGELHIGGVMLRLVEDLGEFFNFFSIFLLPTCHSSLISLFLSPFNHSGIFALMWNAIWLHLSTFVENIFRHISDTEFEII